MINLLMNCDSDGGVHGLRGAGRTAHAQPAVARGLDNAVVLDHYCHVRHGSTSYFSSL